MKSNNPTPNKNTIDLTQGSVGKLMFKLALPVVISQLVNTLYNIVDRMYIGHIPETGVDALTGLGLCFPIILIVSAFSLMFGMGGAPNASIQMGKGNNDKAEQILGNCFSALICSSFILMGIIFFFGEDLLYLFGASDITIHYALQYLNIYIIGTPFVQISLGMNMFITAQGFTKFSMITVLIGAITNIILDPIFIYGFGMGVQGAGLATIISQFIAACWVLKFLFGNKTTLKLKKENMKIKKEIITPVIALGVSPFIMQSTESLLNIAFNSSLSKYGGDLAVSTMTIISSIMTLCYMPLSGFNQGIQPIISYNYGAGRIDRVRQAVMLSINICFVYTIISWFALMNFTEVFISIFNNDPELVTFATSGVKLYFAAIFFLGLQISCQQTFVALGFAKVSLVLALLRKVIILIPLIYILPMFIEDKVYAVFLAEPVADTLATAITVLTFIMIMRKTLANSNEETENTTENVANTNNNVEKIKEKMAEQERKVQEVKLQKAKENELDKTVEQQKVKETPKVEEPPVVEEIKVARKEITKEDLLNDPSMFTTTAKMTGVINGQETTSLTYEKNNDEAFIKVTVHSSDDD